MTEWWRDAVGYEVYIRSFADGDGDGVGDLAGLRQRLGHLAWLGVSIVWITPFYPSPMRDHGYDVSDYCDVDPTFGDLAAFDAVVAEAHALGLRVVVDLVPNHSSSDHPWFVESRSSRTNPKRDWYIWRDGAPGGGPPNNWVSHFGGPAWTLDEASGQYWCHLFLPEQPDLNWTNPEVRDAFDEVLRFWLDRGVDGFRVDVAHALMKHPDFPDNPLAADDTGDQSGLGGDWGRFDHAHDLDQPDVTEVYRRWRSVVEPYGAALIGEVYVLDAQRLSRYVRERDGLHLSFWFAPLHVDWSFAALEEAVLDAAATNPSGVAWVQSSHDRPRPVTRFGGGAAGRERALVLATLLLGLPGVPFLYQGEELGLPDGALSADERQDPLTLRGGVVTEGRDGCRTPMPWGPGPGLGFTSAERAWLPFGGREPSDTVAVQRGDPGAPLHRYRALVALRRGEADLHDEPITWTSADEPVLAYRRGSLVVAANTADGAAAAPLPPGGWARAFSSVGARDSAEPGAVRGAWRLRPREAVILRRVADA